MRGFKWMLFVVLALGLSGCMDGPTIYAPVGDVNTIDAIPKTGRHQVLPGETLYSIAWRYGLDSQTLAARNHLSRPFRVYPDQIIYLTKRYAQHQPNTQQSITTVANWQWPADGAVIGHFAGLNKGINIGGHIGDPIFATESGRVVYSGSGLRGYGNLIIIEHNNGFMTAYAHNSVVLVKESDWVRIGQKIAEMGNTGAQQVMLHFEIRREGQPVDPLNYLSGR